MVVIRSLIAASVIVYAAGCNRSAESKPAPGPEPAQPAANAAAKEKAATSSIVGDTTRAEIGKPAPAFRLRDLDGKEVSLSDYRGKVVVLEWFNPGCPFVNLSHTKGSLKTFAEEKQKEGIAWLAINSSAPGKQGYGEEANKEGKQRLGITYPILLDESGQVGRSYGAQRTPHLFVIDDTGTLVYAGAIDNSPDGEGESPTGGQLINYVQAALDDLAEKRPVQTPTTKAYGCGVKYGS